MKVFAGKPYIYTPGGLFDLCSPASTATAGQRVRVVNLHGCPRANTMGQCYIEDAATGEFLGMVCTSSLTPAPKVRKQCVTATTA
jgi:hypothetical protein